MNAVVNRVRGVGRLIFDMKEMAVFTANHDYNNVFLPMRKRLQASHGLDLRPLRLLDFGCGYTYPLVVLFAPEVREIVGLDIDAAFRDGLRALAEAHGSKAHPRRIVPAMLKYARCKRYYGELKSRFNVVADHTSYHLMRYDGGRLPFDDASFDCVVSNGVLQEIPCTMMGDYAREIARVLKPGGTIDLEWHNFYSWGGHCRGSEKLGYEVHWGHLQGGPYMPSLNKMRPEEIEAAFRGSFADVRVLAHDRSHRIAGQDPDHKYETEHLLTPEVYARIAEYPRELLLTRGYIITGRHE